MNLHHNKRRRFESSESSESCATGIDHAHMNELTEILRDFIQTFVHNPSEDQVCNLSENSDERRKKVRKKYWDLYNELNDYCETGMQLLSEQHRIKGETERFKLTLDLPNCFSANNGNLQGWLTITPRSNNNNDNFFLRFTYEETEVVATNRPRGSQQWIDLLSKPINVTPAIRPVDSKKHLKYPAKIILDLILDLIEQMDSLIAIESYKNAHPIIGSENVLKLAIKAQVAQDAKKTCNTEDKYKSQSQRTKLLKLAYKIIEEHQQDIATVTMVRIFCLGKAIGLPDIESGNATPSSESSKNENTTLSAIAGAISKRVKLLIDGYDIFGKELSRIIEIAIWKTKNKIWYFNNSHYRHPIWVVLLGAPMAYGVGNQIASAYYCNDDIQKSNNAFYSIAECMADQNKLFANALLEAAQTRYQSFEWNMVKDAPAHAKAFAGSIWNFAGDALIDTIRHFVQGISSAEASFVDHPPTHKQLILDRHLDNDEVKLPDNIKDNEIVLYVSAPLNTNGITTDTLIDKIDLAKAFFDKALILTDLTVDKYLGQNMRFYSFVITSPENGEVIPDEPELDKINTVTLAYILNKLFDTSPEKEDSVKEYLATWYNETFQDPHGNKLALKGEFIEFERDKDDPNKILNVLYKGDVNNNYLLFHKYSKSKEVAETSKETNRSYKRVAKEFYNKRSQRLFVWTGVNQAFKVPADLLRPAKQMEGQLTVNIHGAPATFSVNASHVAYSAKRFFEKRRGGEAVEYHENGDPNKHVRYRGHAHYIDWEDPLAKAIIKSLKLDGKSPAEKIMAITNFMSRENAENLKYRSEQGVIGANRPFLLTVMQGGGDCDGLSVAMATLFAIANTEDPANSVDVALAYADSDLDKLKPETKAANHILLAVPEKTLLNDDGSQFIPGSVIQDPYTLKYKGQKWIILEPQPNSKIGKFGLSESDMQLRVRQFQILNEKTGNLLDGYRQTH